MRAEVIGETVVSRDGAIAGTVVGTRFCRLEGCRGLCLGTRWPDGKLTWPCTKGMDHDTDTRTWRIL